MLIKCAQHSPEWLDLRRGNCTASRVKDALKTLTRKTKNGGPGESAASRRNYMVELVTERLTGMAVNHYVSPAMEWGIETEKYARAAYEVVSGNDVDLVGLYRHDALEGFLASPDGLIGEDGLLEIKCPETTTHVDWMLADEVPEDHIYQCMSQMACSGRAWCDFISFDPRLPQNSQVFIKRLERNDEFIGLIEEGVKRFLSEVDAMTDKLGGRRYEEVLPNPKPKVHVELGITDDDIEWAMAQQEKSVGRTVPE